MILDRGLKLHASMQIITNIKTSYSLRVVQLRRFFECFGLGEEKVGAILYNIRQVAMIFYSELQGKDIFVLELVDDAQQNLLVQHDSKVITSKNVIFTSNLKLPH